MKKITKLLLAATLLAAAMPSAAQTITVNKQTANCKQKTELFKPSVDLSKYNKRVVANGVEKYTKKDNPTRSIKKDAAEYVTVTFKYKYDDTKFSPDGTAFIFGDNNGDVYGSTEFFDYDEANNVYTNCVCQVPVGKYDVLGEACPLIDGGYLYGTVYYILEQVSFNQDTTITIDFTECTNRYEFKPVLPNGEEVALPKFVVNENNEWIITTKGNVPEAFYQQSLILKGYGLVTTHWAYCDCEWDGGIYPTTLFFNEVSDRYKIGAECAFVDNDSNCHVVKLENKSMAEHLFTNDASNYLYYEDTFTPSLSNDMDNKGVMALTAHAVLENAQIHGIDFGYIPLSDSTVKLYIDAAQSESNEADKYDVMITPKFGDKDNTHVETYTWQDLDGTLVTQVDTIVDYQLINGLPIIINKNKEIEYVNLGSNDYFRLLEGGMSMNGLPGHPQFAYVKSQKAQNYGSNCPINAVMLRNTDGLFSPGKYPALDCNYIGRYGEKRDVDLGAVQAEVKYNDEVISNNYETMANDLYNFAFMNKPNGIMTAHIVNENMMVDGLQGKNVTDIYCDQNNEDWTAPTLQMLQFKDAKGNITDRFESAEDGTLEFAGGDFDFTVDMTFYTQWFNCKPMSVDVSYAPNNGTNWETLDVTEIPENFYMPGFGYFYRGALQNVEGEGWFDLKVRLTDLSGNWQEQVISPAFRIGNVQSGIGSVKVGNATEVARYTVDGRAIGAPQAGVNIVKMSDGSVKKVWVK